MILYRPTWKANGQRKTGKIWWMEATVDGRRHRRSLGVRDKHAAQAIAADLVRRLELRAAGIGVEEEQTTASPLALIREYEAELVRRRSSPQHVARTVQRLETLLAKPRAIPDVTPGSLRKALSRVASTGVTAQTQNAYRVAAHAFFAWLIREGKATTNPVAQVARVRPGECTRQRRALTQEEIGRLVSASPPHRGVCYLTAATTGLRRSELAALVWADVDAENATVRVRSTAAKNRREAVLPLPEGTVMALRDLRDAAPPEALVFRHGVPRTSTMRKDLATAKIPVATPAGVVDLHALRATYGTMLARAGVSLAQAQKLMRHSTPALTANVYVKLQMDDAREAVARIDVHGLAS